MNVEILKQDLSKEYFTPERCHILESSNSTNDKELSIARARVESGITTAFHYLDGVTERYIITQGYGRVQVGNQPTIEVGVGDVVIIPPNTRQRITNIGETDLIFYALCTPRFKEDSYYSEE
ncbi:cupin domain-containing protein [Thermoproteota archaeon]